MRVIYTIGYGKRELDELVALLREHEINYVVDVRSAPFSRFRPEFSRDALSVTLKEQGVRYVFMGDLLGGRPEDKDCYVEGKVDYERMKNREAFKRGIARLRTAWNKALQVCLMCSEARPEHCHRSKLIGEVLEAEGLRVQHIDAEGGIKSQQEVLQILSRGQPSLFGEAFTSRKRYGVESK